MLYFLFCFLFLVFFFAVCIIYFTFNVFYVLRFFVDTFRESGKMSIFLFFFWGRFGAGRFIQPAATVFSQFCLRVCFKNNLNCKFPPSLSPFPPTTSLAAAASLLFYLFYFFRFLHEANEAWRCVCAPIAVNWYGITYIHKNECAKCVCVCLSACVTSFAWRQSNAIWD